MQKIAIIGNSAELYTVMLNTMLNNLGYKTAIHDKSPITDYDEQEIIPLFTPDGNKKGYSTVTTTKQAVLIPGSITAPQTYDYVLEHYGKDVNPVRPNHIIMTTDLLPSHLEHLAHATLPDDIPSILILMDVHPIKYGKKYVLTVLPKVAKKKKPNIMQIPFAAGDFELRAGVGNELLSPRRLSTEYKNVLYATIEKITNKTLTAKERKTALGRR